MQAMHGGQAPALTGGPAFIRGEGRAPYREPGSRNPEDALAVLLEAGASPDSKAPEGSTLLHQAVQLGSLNMIRALAESGVNFDQTNDDGLTPLEVAEGAPSPDERPDQKVREGAPPEDIAKLLRELMDLPPAPASPTTPKKAVSATVLPSRQNGR